MFLSLIEWIGTAAFALSGAMEAIKKNMDLLGVIVLGVMAAVGGGCFRDIILGIVPASMFSDPIYTMIACVVSILLFVYARLNNQELHFSYRVDFFVNMMDAIGLAAFTVVGIDKGIEMGYGQYPFFLMFLGVITGVGGGVLRDICCMKVPAIFSKRIYACASIVGAIIMVYGYPVIGYSLAIGLASLSIIVIRICASIFHWHLPRVRKEETL